MKLGVVPENLAERLVLLSGVLPPGIFEGWFGIMLARTVMAATKLDVAGLSRSGSRCGRRGTPRSDRSAACWTCSSASSAKRAPGRPPRLRVGSGRPGWSRPESDALG